MFLMKYAKLSAFTNLFELENIWKKILSLI